MTPHTVARPEAGPVLAEIRQAGLATGLLSNTHWPRDWHERFLERDGLTDLIDVRVYSSELEHVKPHPEAFRAVLEKLRCRATESVFVGDRPIDDIAGAAQLGMRTIWLPNGRLTEADVAPDATASSLTDVPSIVASWRIDSG
jgi:putative hydrolase of the HAD superfamily